MRKQFVTQEKWEQVNPENKRLLKEFMLTLKQEGRSKATIETYEGNAKRFLIYALEQLDNRCITDLRKKDFRNYGLYLRESGVATASHNHYISTIRSWCERLEDDEDIDYDNNMCRKVKGIKIERVKQITFLTDDQVTKLYYELLSLKKYQLAAWLALAYDSTGRRMELHQVTKEGFEDPNRNCTNAVSKKGGKKEALVYFERTKEAVAFWMEQLPKESCIGCARRKNGKCTIMSVIPKVRRCFMTLEQAIISEVEIINYIDSGNYPPDIDTDSYYRTLAANRLKKLNAIRA